MNDAAIISRLPTKVTDSVRRLNPHLYGPMAETKTQTTAQVVASGRRVRQSPKALMNKLESDFFELLKRYYPTAKIRPQAKKYRLCSGAFYKPDFTAIVDGKEMAWECKGPQQGKNVARGILTIKFAASEWPEVTFTLVFKENGEYRQQVILSGENTQ